jgi:hypothetical protein
MPGDLDDPLFRRTMNQVNNVSLGWKNLETVLNRLVRAINQRTIETGYGLTKEEGENGVIIRLEAGKTGQGDGSEPSMPDEPWKFTPDHETAAWHSVQVMDENCNRYSMWVWGGTPH